MKPRNTHRNARHLPLIVCIAMTAAQVAQAGIFVDDTAGNAQPTAADNGANTIRANGGTSSSPFILTGSAITLSGDAGEISVVDISAPNYTVNNSGVLVGTNHDGIFSSNPFVLNNTDTNSDPFESSAKIEGIGAGRKGINAPSATIINSGFIRSEVDDAIFFSADGGSVTNTGFITGLGAGGISGADGILGGANLTIDNQLVISGSNGVKAGNSLELDNSITGFITGNALIQGDAIVANNDASISNFGNIQATASGVGISVGNGAVITNETSFSSIFPFSAIDGGVILGNNGGIEALDGLTFNNENLGNLETVSGDGIFAGNEAIINNFQGARISAISSGIDVLDGAEITNGGIITGGTARGILAGDSLILNNSGTIRVTDANADGNLDGDGLETAGNALITNRGTIIGATGIRLGLFSGPATINNLATGLIEGDVGSAIIVSSGTIEVPGLTVNNSGRIISNTAAILGNIGNEVFNFELGSNVIGDVLGGDGMDIVNFKGGLSTPGGINNTVRGDVKGISVINKTLGGVAFIGLPGDELSDIEVDTVNITTGGLYLNGNVRAFTFGEKTTINAGGAAVGGIGAWNSNLNITAGGISAGAIPINLTNSPNQAIGIVTITGDVDHSPGSFIRMDIRPDSAIINGVNSDQIRQTGIGNTFDVGGAGLRISATDNNKIIRNGIYNVVDSANPITGGGTFTGVGMQFNNNISALDTGFIGSEVSDTGISNKNTVLTQNFTSLSFGDGTNVDLVITHNYAGLPGLTNNQRSLGAALDASVSSADPLTQDFISALDYSNLGVVQETMALLDPSGVLDMSSTIVSSNYRIHRLAQDHLASTRTGTMTQQAGPAMTDSKGAMLPSAPMMSSSSSRGSVWGAASFDWKDGSGDATADFDGQDASFTAGFDYRVAPNVLLGILLDGSRGDYDYDNGSSDIESYRVAVYGTYGSATGIYADFLFGYGDHSIDLDRSWSGLLNGNSSNSSTDATGFQGLATVGYAMESNQVKHGPFVGLEYQTLDVDGYTQKGAFPLEVDGFDTDSLRALIGYRVEATMDRFKPYASLTYAHEFEDGSTRTSASLPAGASFDVEGGAQDSAFLISVGTGINLMQNLDMSVGYRGEISTGDGIDSHGATLGMSYSF